MAGAGGKPDAHVEPLSPPCGSPQVITTLRRDRGDGRISETWPRTRVKKRMDEPLYFILFFFFISWGCCPQHGRRFCCTQTLVVAEKKRMPEKQNTTSFIFTFVNYVCLRDICEEILLKWKKTKTKQKNNPSLEFSATPVRLWDWKQRPSFIAFDAWEAGPSSEWLQMIWIHVLL